MAFTLPELGYATEALEPFIDRETMKIHHGKHHQTYTDKFNAALEGQDKLLRKSAEEIIRDLNSVPESIRPAVKNHGGGYINHKFFWPLLKKNHGKGPDGEIGEMIKRDFGDFEAFKKAFSAAATGLFGSGWAWLVLNKNKLEIHSLPNQDSPLTLGMKPLLTIDVWEHAYYLKYQNRRPEYVEAFFNVINWEKVNELLGSKRL